MVCNSCLEGGQLGTLIFDRRLLEKMICVLMSQLLILLGSLRLAVTRVHMDN